MPTCYHSIIESRTIIVLDWKRKNIAINFILNMLFQGVLRIEVLEAKDLIKKDIGVFKKGSSDPYVILRGIS